LSQGPSGFIESSAASQLADASLALTGFGTALADLEHDGDLDLLVANGKVQLTTSDAAKRSENASSESDPLSFWRSYAEPNQLFLNQGRGSDGSVAFREIKSSREPFTSVVELSRALCTGDIDNDGDLDLLVTNGAGPARLFRNDAAKVGHWLMIRAVLPEFGGRDAYGAVITLRSKADALSWRQSVNPGSSYLSSHDPRVHFGLGPIGHIDEIQLRWPDGTEETFPGSDVDRHLVLRRGEGIVP
jgi:hypothetical protein